MPVLKPYTIQVDQENVSVGVSPIKEGREYLLEALPVLNALGAKVYPVKSQPNLLVATLGNRWIQCTAGIKTMQYRLDRSTTDFKTVTLPISPRLQKNILLLPLTSFSYLGAKTTPPDASNTIRLEGGIRQQTIRWAKSLGITAYNRLNRSNLSIRLEIPGGRLKRQSQNIIIHCIASKPGYLQLFEVVEQDVYAVLSQDEEGLIYYYLNEEASMVKTTSRCRVKLSVGGDKAIQFIAIFSSEKIPGHVLKTLREGSFTGDVALFGTSVQIK